MNVQTGLKAFGALLVGLFVISILTGVTFIGIDKMQDVACENAGTGYSWEGGSCLNETAGTAVTVDSVTYIGYAKTGAITVMSLLALFIIVALFAIVIKMAVAFTKGNGMS